MRLRRPIFNIELATGRVRPQTDKGLLDPPSLDDVDPTKFGITASMSTQLCSAFVWANEKRKARVHQPHREPRVDAQLRAQISVPPSFLGKTANADGARGR